MLPGERHREHVLKTEEENRTFRQRPELFSMAAVLTDTAMRPDECYGEQFSEI
jgi:hypothetical protein